MPKETVPDGPFDYLLREWVVRQMRKHAGENQSEFGRQTLVSKQEVNDLANGKCPSRGVVHKVLVAYNVDVHAFLREMVSYPSEVWAEATAKGASGDLELRERLRRSLSPSSDEPPRAHVSDHAVRRREKLRAQPKRENQSHRRR